MAKKKRKMKATAKCAYIKYCYLAEAQNCFGYMIDCPLYMVSNDEEVPEKRFHEAMNRLIDKARHDFSADKIGGWKPR